MKKSILVIDIVGNSICSKTFAQDSTQQHQLSQLLTQYYNIKDALVAGNGNLASVKA
jgi:hypothetical protein